jgi:hypothetical protein
MLFSLIGTCFLSGFLCANPCPGIDIIGQKEVMAACAVKYLQQHPQRHLTINHLVAHKPSLVRTVSEIVLAAGNLSLRTNEQKLIKQLAEQDCPVPTTPKTKRRKLIIAPDNNQHVDCIVKNSPPPSPKSKRRVVSPEFIENASKQVNRLHRQWKTKWSSDGDLQAMLEESTSKSSPRKRTSSDSK